MAPGTTKAYQPPESPAGTINTTDHDSRIVRTTGQPAVQGYNVQAAVNEHQIVIAAEVTVNSPDFGYLEPMVDAIEQELNNLGNDERPGVVLADAGYWHKRQMENIVSRGIRVLVPPDSGLRKGTTRDGTAVSTRSCATCSPPTTAPRYTENAKRRSSPCSDR